MANGGTQISFRRQVSKKQGPCFWVANGNRSRSLLCLVRLDACYVTFSTIGDRSNRTELTKRCAARMSTLDLTA